MADKTTTEQSVESALAELREMFRGEAISIEFRDYSGIRGCEGQRYVKIASGTVERAGASLADAMVEVRQRHAEQGKES